VYALAVDPEGALLDYLEMFYNLRRRRLGADPARRDGLRDHDRARPADVLLTGKATEATRRKQPGKASGRATTRW
jgi:hypothetical protein